MNQTNNQTMTTNKNNDKAIKVAKPVKPSKSVPDKRKDKQAEQGAKAIIAAIAETAPIKEAKAAPTPAVKKTDATPKQEGKKRQVTKPFDPTSKEWKPTCKFGTAMKRAKKWLSKWKSLKSDDERRGKYYSAALGFANRAIEKASNEAETTEAKQMQEEVTNA